MEAEVINNFLSNPIVGLIGYVLTVVSACIAIWQARGKSKAIAELNRLKVTINQTENRNEVKQGDKSQYFQENSGPVTIDNKG